MKRSEQFWDNMSGSYDEKAKDKTFKVLLEKTIKYLQQDDVVLDFGCATGLYSFEFADKVMEIHAFDTAPKMIEKAKHRAKKEKFENISFSCAGIFDDTFKSGTFEVILAFNVLLYFKDPYEVINRIFDLLKPGGILISSTACINEVRNPIALFSKSIIYLLKKLRILPDIHFLRTNDLERMISDVGFKIEEASEILKLPATEYFIAANKGL